MTDMKKIDPAQVVECPQMTPERQLLWDAANYMEKHGQNRSRLLDYRTGAACIYGSIAMAHSGETRVVHPYMFRAPCDGTTISKAVHMMRAQVPAINSFCERNDQATVVAAMRQAALSC